MMPSLGTRASFRSRRHINAAYKFLRQQAEHDLRVGLFDQVGCALQVSIN